MPTPPVISTSDKVKLNQQNYFHLRRFIMIDSDNRPWGRWEEYLNEPGYRVKRIIVNPGKRFHFRNTTRAPSIG